MSKIKLFKEYSVEECFFIRIIMISNKKTIKVNEQNFIEFNYRIQQFQKNLNANEKEKKEIKHSRTSLNASLSSVLNLMHH